MTADHDIAIVGSGFSGLGMAIRLKQAGIDDFVVLERADEVGGTWQANTYPGCACDVPSHLYSFSFAPNPDGRRPTRRSPRSGRTCAAAPTTFGIRPHLRLGCAVESATWLDGRAPLGARDLAGHAPRARARRRHGAADRAADPRHPRSRRLRGRRLPLGPLEPRRRPRRQAGRLDRHRRVGDPVRPRDPAGGRAAARVPAHAAVGVPHSNRPISRRERRLYRALPVLQRLMRGGIYADREMLVLGFVKQPAADEGRRADRAQAPRRARSPTRSCARE